jgi:large subunit ribosomal protein L4
MLTVPMYNMAGQKVAEVEVTAPNFCREPHRAVLHQAVTAYLANQRAGTASTKTRGQVAGGGRKAWRQKGTGRARQGSRRAPHWKGGGVVFGPRPRSFRPRLPEKMRRMALASAIGARIRGGEVKLLDRLEVERPSTKSFLQLLENLEFTGGLVVAENASLAVRKSAANLGDVGVANVNNLNVHSLLSAPCLLFTQEAWRTAEQLWGGA